MKIELLAVDDEKFNLLLLRESLKGENISVTTCVDANEAIQLVKERSFDVVLLDVIMPGLDGFEVRKIIHGIAPDLPIIFLTAMVDNIDNALLKRISEDKATYYIKKPFQREELIGRIESVVKEYRGSKETLEYYSKLEHDLTLASEVQQILLPDWVVVEDELIFSSLYRPFQKVSGDIFDVIKISPGNYFVFIGDIVGHGVQAALYMSAVQSLVKMFIFNKGDALEPHEFLNAINRIFCYDLGGSSCMTCIAAIFNFNNNTVRFQSAGHPTLIVGEEGKEEVVPLNPENKGGIPIGWSSNYSYEPEDTLSYNFTDETVFFMLTDGLPESRNANSELLGMDRLMFLLGSLLDDTIPISSPFRFLEALQQIGFNDFSDDMSLITVKKFAPATKENHFLKTISPADNNLDTVTKEATDFIMRRLNDPDIASRASQLIPGFLEQSLRARRNRQQAKPAILLHITTTSDPRVCYIEIYTKNDTDAPAAKPTSFAEEKAASELVNMELLLKLSTHIERNAYGVLNVTRFSLK